MLLFLYQVKAILFEIFNIDDADAADAADAAADGVTCSGHPTFDLEFIKKFQILFQRFLFREKEEKGKEIEKK